MKRVFGLFKPASIPFAGSIGLLAPRLVAGLAFMFHGWGKIQHPMSWAGPDSKIPGVFLFLAAVSEFAGGLAWMLGLLTPLASFGLLCTMTVAVWFHAVTFGDPFVARGPGKGSYELAAIFWCISLLLILAGPGKLSLDRVVFGKREESK